MLNTETLRILKRGEQNLGLPYIAAVGLKLLDKGVLSSNLALAKGWTATPISDGRLSAFQ